MGNYEKRRVLNSKTMSVSKSIDILIKNTSNTLRTKDQYSLNLCIFYLPLHSIYSTL